MADAHQTRFAAHARGRGAAQRRCDGTRWVYAVSLAVIVGLYSLLIIHLLSTVRSGTILAVELALHTIMIAMVAYPLWHTWRWRRQVGRWASRNLAMVPQTSVDAIATVVLYAVFVWQLGIDHGKTWRPWMMACFVVAVALMFVRGACGVRMWRRAWRRVADHVVCAECGYNLTGLDSARCPECGRQLGAVREISQGRQQGRIREPM